jgi:hypothetical protein
MKLQELKEKTIDSFQMMWSEDAELRGVAMLAGRVMDALDGPGCAQFAATSAAQILLAVWKGCEPMFTHLATKGISRISEAHAQRGILPSPPLEEQDADDSHTNVFDRVADSYKGPSKDCLELIDALPRGVVGAIVKVQATFRGLLLHGLLYGLTF